MGIPNFDSENLVVDWISFNIQGLTDPQIIARRLFSRFNSFITVDDQHRIRFSDPRNNYNVSLRQYNKNWVGTQIIFSGKNAAYFYKLIKTQKFDWKILRVDQHTLSLGRIDLCFSRTNNPNDTMKSFDGFLVDSRSHIQNHTTTRHIRLQDFPDGKVLKVNRRNNSLHYRVYQKDEDIRFELELKHRQTKLVQDYLFNNQLDIFEDKLVIQYFKYSGQVLRLDYQYTDWLVKFSQKQRYIRTSSSFLTSYFEENHTFSSNIKELEQLYRFLQFLSFSQTQPSKSIEIASHKYQIINFEIQDFMQFIQFKNASEYKTKQLIDFFQQLTNTPNLVSIFSDHQFKISATFPFAHVDGDSGVWKAQIYFNYQLYSYQYPFLFPKSYLNYQDKYDMQIKLQIMQSFANTSLKKKFNLSEFLDRFQNTPNQTKAHIKNLIINTFQALRYDKLIQTDIVLHVLGNKRKNKPRLQKILHIELKQLTSLLISKATTLYYFEII
jgi:hypothetical protein